MDEQIELTQKQREYVKPIDAEYWNEWDRIILRDKNKIRHLSVLKKLPGLSNVTVNNAINWHMGSDRVRNLINDYFNTLK